MTTLSAFHVTPQNQKDPNRLPGGEKRRLYPASSELNFNDAPPSPDRALPRPYDRTPWHGVARVAESTGSKKTSKTRTALAVYFWLVCLVLLQVFFSGTQARLLFTNRLLQSLTMEKKRVALVTGGNKGIGFFIVKKLCQRLPKDLWVVVLGSRSVENGEVGEVWLDACALSVCVFRSAS